MSEQYVDPNSGAAPQPGGYAGPEGVELGHGTPAVGLDQRDAEVTEESGDENAAAPEAEAPDEQWASEEEQASEEQSPVTSESEVSEAEAVEAKALETEAVPPSDEGGQGLEESQAETAEPATDESEPESHPDEE